MVLSKALRLNHDSILEPTYGALFQFSVQARIQKDSSHLRETAIDAGHQAPEIQRFARIAYGVAEKTHGRHVTPNHRGSHSASRSMSGPMMGMQITQRTKAPLWGALRSIATLVGPPPGGLRQVQIRP